MNFYELGAMNFSQENNELCESDDINRHIIYLISLIILLMSYQLDDPVRREIL